MEQFFKAILDFNQSNPGIYSLIILFLGTIIGFFTQIGKLILESLKKIRASFCEIGEVQKLPFGSSRSRNNSKSMYFITYKIRLYNPKKKDLFIYDPRIVIWDSRKMLNNMNVHTEKEFKSFTEKEIHSDLLLPEDQYTKLNGGQKYSLELVFQSYGILGKLKWNRVPLGRFKLK